ncbi:glycoside hydrolase family 43 protein [Mariniflexile sp.]|uniref:glycoside hydrolase family 43 protein n=1 Tax=Mariniflexile sp. TaxID=1979402 RepID=UPI00404868C9
MKSCYFIIPLFILPILTCHSQIELSKKGQEYYYSNPIITGMNPDPSICRVGEDYYLVTSTFGFYPGLPIYHSRDLVHWKLIGYGIDRPSQLNLNESEGDKINLYAATIRYNKGVFYIINTNTGRRHEDRNFVITATNPAGPWSEAHYIEGAPRIDPSLFFDDDGKVYYTGNDTAANPVFEKQRNIWMQEIDINTWKLVGNKVIVVDPGNYYKGLVLSGKENLLLDFFEGPHVYKKDGKYYLLISHGGTFWEHAVSIWNSDSIFGPYVLDNKNPIATNRDFSHNSYIHHTGHADMVETQNGEWWMVLLGTRPYGGDFTNLGRETCLVPVDWSGEWPVVNPLGPVGRIMPIHRRPNLPNHPWEEKDIRDNFDTKKLGLDWNFMQTPKEVWWHLDAPSGKLKINLRPEIIDKNVNPSFIGQRQAHKNFTAITKMEFIPKVENETAGMVITRDVSNQFQLVKTLKNGAEYLQLIRKEVVNDKIELIIAETQVSSKALYLKMEALEQLFTFSFSEDGKNWKILAKDQDGRLLSNALGIGRFTGTFIGMYATSKGKESSNSALFDWFEYSGF